MRTIHFQKKFKKDLERVWSRGKKIKKLNMLIDYIAKHGTAPLQRRPHKLKGTWSPAFECHVDNRDWLLIYIVTKTTVRLYRTGSHSDLFD